MILKYIVDCNSAGKTIKYVVKHKMELSERLIKKLKYDSKILCNSSPVYVNSIVHEGDFIEVVIDFVEECEEIIPEDIKIDIIYEDESIIVLNKQHGIVVHPTSTHPSGTIANGIAYYFKQMGINKKIRPVSRLDRDTTGVIIFAKNQFVQESLIRQMADKTFIKEYIGVVNGIIESPQGTIDLPIARLPGSIMQRHVSPDGVHAVTHYQVIEYYDNTTLLKFSLETGRTHQIRVHCQAIGHPLIGDTLYSDIPSEFITRQALHSFRAEFLHPFTKTIMKLNANIPEDIKILLGILKK